MTRNFVALALLPLLAACDATIHQYPGEDLPEVTEAVEIEPFFHLPEVKAYKQLTFDNNWQCTTELLPQDSIVADDAPFAKGTQLNVTVDVCRGTLEDDELAEWQSDVVSRHSFTSHNLTLDYSDFQPDQLPHGNYHLIAWADYMPELYNIDRLTAIETQLDRIPLHGHGQEAYAGRMEFSITDDNMPANHVWHEPVELRRTQGRFRIVATDLEAFTAKGRSAEGITVKAIFTAYISCGFNAATDLPNKYTASYTFNATPDSIAGQEMDMLTHYVFTLPEGETVVQASFVLYDRNGEVINQCHDLLIPVSRGRETIVRGRFLTAQPTQGAGGMGIDENFEDEYVIEIRN